MKKLIVTAMGLVAGASLVHAQGFIAMFGSVAGITTNNVAYGQTAVGPGGKTTGVNAFDYQLLFATSTTAGDSSPLGADWQLATILGGATLIGNSFASPGGMTSTSGSGGTAVNMASGTTYSVMLVGWSAALGSSWGTVSTLLQQGFAGQANPLLFFGNSGIGSATPFSAIGAGDPAVFPNMFANGSVSLFQAIPTPEPTTLALAGLGGLSMLFLRRRKA